MEDSAQRTSRNGHASGDTKREPPRSEETMSALSALNDKPEPRQITNKQAPKSTNDISDTQATLRQAFPHVYSSSRAPSTRTSSSSLQALNEDTVVDARSHGSSAGRSPRRTSRPSDAARPDYPVYPDQSYASLQSQVHPTWQPPHLRTRSSYPTAADPIPRHARVSRTAGNTPISSPGLFSMRTPTTTPPSGSDESIGSPFLHPTHLQPPKETHTAEVDRDVVTGNKLINQYEILEELGRGEHGKVKLGQHVVTKKKVAIKIVQRYSKRRRLGKLGDAEDKVKKEVAILKKARHPNVVSLLEVIDDPNSQKVYIVLEYVENGEIVWRKKGVREVVHVDKLRFEREKAGIPDTPAFLEESRQFIKTAQHLRRQREKARERVEAQAADAQQGPIPAWSLEHGVESDEESDEDEGLVMRRSSTRSAAATDDSPSQSSMQDAGMSAIDGSMYGAYADYSFERRFSTTSSSFGYAPSEPEWSNDNDDMSYIPCLTISEARSAFRDSVLGLEYLHYQGIIHRDIKPANLLMTSSYRVKISDFGVSYLGRPMHDEEEEQVGETDAADFDNARELSKTVGTPAFYAPELCYTGEDFEETIGSVPKITGAIDVWSLGVTLYGMVFGRLPFVSDDEYTMFQTIVKKEVFIPRKRLAPVKDHTFDTEQNDCRDVDQLLYEPIDDELYDLLRRLLTKDPVRRITLKEIKHHPWTLNGLPNRRAWVEETDPGYQSKGKKIEVSNEEVSGAVSKVPFIQRVRSNVVKWFGGRSSKDKDPRKHSSNPSTDTLSSNSSISTFGKSLPQSRRSSLKGDEDVRYSKEHPLAQSVTASPVEEESASWSSYFESDAPPHVRKTIPAPIVTPRPQYRRTKSSMSNAESTKTVRKTSMESTTRPRTGTPSIIEALGVSNFGSNIGSLFSGSSRRSSRGTLGGSWSRRTSPTGADREPPHSEAVVALSNASAVGQVRSTGLWHTQYTEPSEVPASAHRRNRSHQLGVKSSRESLNLTKEALLRRRRSDLDGTDDTLRPQVESALYSTDSLQLPTLPPPEPVEPCSHGLTISTPSAATISSSSADDFTSGMSQSASHPSIPSVVSGASSLSGEGLYLGKDNSLDDTSPVPSILRTGETVKARLQGSSPRSSTEEDESHYYCDDEDEYDDDSEDEGLVIGKKNHSTKAPIPTGTKTPARTSPSPT